MLSFVLATTRPQAWQQFAAVLSAQPEVHLQMVASGTETLKSVHAVPPHLVIIDAGLPDATPLELVRQLLLVNAMVNTVVVSPLSDKEFHEASEGLGILGRLPEDPGASDATGLLGQLKRILGQ